MESWYLLQLVDHGVSTRGIYSDLWICLMTWSIAMYVHGILQHQTCVNQTKAQYERSNMILTKMLSSPLCQDVLSNDCIKAIQKFQCSRTKKVQYLEFYVCKNISMSFDTMTTSPVQSVNSSIKNRMGVALNSKTRWVGRCLCIKHELGLTKRTLCGIILFKLNTFFSHVFAWP